MEQRGRKFGMGEMPFEVARAAVERYSALCAPGGSERGLREVIPSTMGEPLLYTHFDELLNLCGAHGVPLNLTTNGSFPGVWGSEEGMARLLAACSDIKVSCMGWGESFCEMMPGLTFDKWKRNVERLVELKKQWGEAGSIKAENREAEGLKAKSLKAENHEAERIKAGSARVATVSLQVTLHRKNFEVASEILQWAESIGVDRIKWNLPVFLSVAPAGLRERYMLSDGEIEVLRQSVASERVRCEGSLFFGRRLDAVQKGEAGASQTMMDRECPFVDELWVLPDGSTQRCPNPERRFGNPGAEMAKCENCPMK